MKELLKRLSSPVTIPAVLALIYFVVKTWIGFEIPEWDKFVTLTLAVLVAFGVVNDPSQRLKF